MQRAFWWVAGGLALTGCLREPELREAQPDGGQSLDAGLDAALPDAGDATVLVDGMAPDAELDHAVADAEPDVGADAAQPDAAQPDAEAPCAPGTSEICGVAEGVCESGTRICRADGAWSECFDAVVPGDELCNGLDDDCDGETDEALERDCGNAVGACQQGLQTCTEGAWSACDGEVQPVVEACNGLDDDCDGEPDEALARPCGSDVGVCQVGVELCDGGAWQACSAAVLPGQQAEACDGQLADEDCDGVVNEGCVCADDDQRPCGSDVGVCSPGLQTCQANAWSDCQDPIGPQPELCNGIDMDCNGTVDDHPQVGVACFAGVGACRRDGVFMCVAGAVGAPACDAVAAGPEPEACNRIDDDCDGTVDEDTPVVASRRRMSGASNTPVTAGVAARGSSYGVITLEDVGGDPEVRFRLTEAGVPVGEPLVLEEANADILPDTVSLIAADNISGLTDGFIYALGGPTLGSPYLDVGRIDTRGDTIAGRARINPDNDPYDVAMAWTGDGLGVVWTEHGVLAGRAGALWFAYIDNFGARVESVRLLGNRDQYAAPSISWNGNVFAVGYTRVVGDYVSTHPMLATVSVDGEVGDTIVLDDSDGGHTEVVWLPEQRGWMTAWVDTGNRVNALKAAFVSAQGEVGPAVRVATGTISAVSMAPQYIRRSFSAVGLAWQSGSFNAQTIRFTRLVSDARSGNWAVAGGAHVISAVVPATRPMLAAGDGSFGVIWHDGGQQTPGSWLAVGPFGCVSAP